jgi:DNA-binding transcriptional MerR regulator
MGAPSMTLLAPRDVARRLGVSTSRVTQLDREGKLVALRDASGRRFYEAKAVEQFAIAREQAIEDTQHSPI